MSAIQNYAIQNVISRDIENESGLIDSTKKSKQEIFNSLGLNIQNWLISNFKEYLMNFLKHK